MPPARCSIDNEYYEGMDELWWDPAQARRVARFQVVGVDGSAWLLLVEQLPAGTEGSPVERNLVRNVFRPDWGKVMSRPPGRLAEDRAMQIHEGARAERLRLVAVLQDQRGRIRAISRTECP